MRDPVLLVVSPQAEWVCGLLRTIPSVRLSPRTPVVGSSSSSDPHAQERLLFTHYNVPTIDACKAMSTLLDGSCAAEETTTTKFFATKFFATSVS